MKKSPQPPTTPKRPTAQKPNADNVYEVPLGGEGPSASSAPAYEAPSDYEMPIGSISSKSTISSASRSALTGRSMNDSTNRPMPESVANLMNMNPIIPRATLAAERSLRSAESTLAKPQLPLNATEAQADDSTEEYYDHKPLDKSVITIWWRGQMRLQMNFYLAAAIFIVVLLVAVVSTIVWIVLLAVKYDYPVHSSTNEPSTPSLFK